MIEARLGSLEVRFEKAEASLQRLEISFARFDEKLSSLATKDDVRAISNDVARLEGRISQIPTTWQIVGILAALLFGVASVVYTTTNFIGQKAQPVATQTQAK